MVIAGRRLFQKGPPKPSASLCCPMTVPPALTRTRTAWSRGKKCPCENVGMDFAQFTTISFDCYGTLIDWEAGILPLLRNLLASHNQSQPHANILQLYGEFEAQAKLDRTRAIAKCWSR